MTDDSTAADGILAALDFTPRCQAGRDPAIPALRACKNDGEWTARLHDCGHPMGQFTVILCSSHLHVFAQRAAHMVQHGRQRCGCAASLLADVIWGIVRTADNKPTPGPTENGDQS